MLFYRVDAVKYTLSVYLTSKRMILSISSMFLSFYPNPNKNNKKTKIEKNLSNYHRISITTQRLIKLYVMDEIQFQFFVHYVLI